jgi:uncharacterized membrane protein
MNTMIVRTYDTYDDALAVTNELKAINLAQDDISVVAHHDHRDDVGIPDDETARVAGVATGAAIGSVAGSGAGLLAGLGLLTIPGMAPLLAAGWVAATAAGASAGALAGAATGGLVAAFVDSGISERDAHTYAEAVRRGGILVTVRANDSNSMRIKAIMDRHRPVDLDRRRATWELDGWSTFDPKDRPFSHREILAEQHRYR